MIVVLNKRGSSFRGSHLYYGHDKGAATTRRIGWTYTMNMLTSCINKAWRVMAYTARNQVWLKESSGQVRTGARLTKPVLPLVISWHPEENPDENTMREAVHGCIDALGLSEHEVSAVQHLDEPHPHVHVTVNTVHPLTGMVAKLKYSKRRLQEWALQFERKQGKVYCMKREENYRKRQQGEFTKYVNPDIAAAWDGSSNGTEFKTILEERGYDLAWGRKRLVVVDPHGKTTNPVRHLQGVNAQAFHEHVTDINPAELPIPEVVIERRNATNGNDVPECLNEQISKHREEWMKVSLRLSHIREIKRIQSAELDDRQEQIDQLKRKIENRGLLARMVNKLFGRGRKTVVQIEQMQVKQDSLRRCFNDIVCRLEEECRLDLQSLAHSNIREYGELANQRVYRSPTVNIPP